MSQAEELHQQASPWPTAAAAQGWQVAAWLDVARVPTSQALEQIKRLVAAHEALSEVIHFTDEGRAIGWVDQGRFESRFVPLLDFGTARKPGTPSTQLSDPAPHALGWRAGLLAFNQQAVVLSSTALFASIDNASLLIALDRMTRQLHCLNFFLGSVPGLLFLPVHERLLKSVRYDHGKYFAAALLTLGFDPARVVIEIPDAAAAHRTFLEYLVTSYRSYGFKVAATLQNPGSILSLTRSGMPDFVIADVEQALRDRMVKPLLAYAEQIGTRLIFDGVDDLDQASRIATLASLREQGVRYLATSSLSTPPGGTAHRANDLDDLPFAAR
ncbi:MAG: EAL domain-containing protein [Janthinobacterium lividum]